MEKSEDKILLERLRASDMDALCSLYMRYASRVRFLAFKLLKDEDGAEDVTHDVFLRLWQTREALPDIDSIPSWLFRMTRNEVFNIIKHRKAGRRYMEFSLRFTPAAEEERVTTDDLLSVINHEIGALPEKQRAAYELSREGGKTYREISSELGISERTVQYHISRVLERIRRIFRA